MCLSANSSQELLNLVKKHKWHFEHLKPQAQEYLRILSLLKLRIFKWLLSIKLEKEPV